MSETIVIAKNTTDENIQIKDLLGITIDSTASVELTPDKFHFYEVASSNDLKSYVYSGNIVINNGEEDLSISDAIDHITLKGSRHIKEEIKDNSHYLDNHIDVPDKPTTGSHILEQQGDSTSFIWIESSKRKTAAILTYYSTASSIENQYIYCSGQPSNQVGFILPKNGKIVSISYMNKSGSTSGANGFVSIRKNGTETEIAKMTINSGQNREYTTTPEGSLNFNAGEWLSCYIVNGELSKPLINIEIEWI